MRDEEAKRHARTFMKAYESWKKTAKEARTKLKNSCLHATHVTVLFFLCACVRCVVSGTTSG